MPSGTVAAVELGSAGGRVVVGRIGEGELRLEEVHRFGADPVRLPDGLHWDMLHVLREVVAGLQVAGRGDDPPTSVGIHGPPRDFGLLDEDDSLIGVPFHGRDARHAQGCDRVHDRARPSSLYRRTGTAFRTDATVYQLAALDGTDALSRARRMLLLPDLIGFWLTGDVAAEGTNASTTGLFDPDARDWAWDLIETLGHRRDLFPVVRAPGSLAGPLRDDVGADTGLAGSTALVRVGSHVASAVAAVPAGGPRFAFVVCDDVAHVGVDVEAPVLSEPSRAAGFTNEAGVDGRVLYLRAGMGLRLVRETLGAWERAGEPEDVGRLLQLAGALPSGGPVVDPDEAVFAERGDMERTIEDACLRAGLRPPSSRAAVIRCILDSLAASYARSIDEATRLSGASVSTVHVVGAGAANELLCRLVSDACGLPVSAGPVDAAAVGNVLVQARARGSAEGDLDALRALVRTTQALRRYEPTGSRTRGGRRAAG
ncbi:MAG TPA: FGGY-family carbohydrate kinase [Candidatus Limnocylindrales bacterium]|nr:FGGY-family carbohydrate kinase [Candidatus Limnocylindrales bacterium]